MPTSLVGEESMDTVEMTTVDTREPLGVERTQKTTSAVLEPDSATSALSYLEINDKEDRTWTNVEYYLVLRDHLLSD